MTAEQETAERTPLRVIEMEQDRLAGTIMTFRTRVLDRLGGPHHTPERVSSMLQALNVPALHLTSAQALEEAVASVSWGGVADDYTERGMQRQAELMQQKTARWFSTLREQLAVLRSDGLITQRDVDDALRITGAPAQEEPAPEPRVSIRFSIVGTASAPERSVNDSIGFRDEQAVHDVARRELLAAITRVARDNGFTLDGDIAVEIGVTRS